MAKKVPTILPTLIGVGRPDHDFATATIPVNYINNDGKAITVYVEGLHYTDVLYEDTSVEVGAELAKDAINVVRAIAQWWNEGAEVIVRCHLEAIDWKAISQSLTMTC
jgi:hypothetical protein